MTEKTCKVGDVIAWADVPDGALYADNGVLWCRRGRFYQPVNKGVAPCACDQCQLRPVTIIALNVPADATAEHLRGLAEVYEVREALSSLDPFDMPADLAHMLEEQAEDDEDEARNTLARILHAAGWRPGMTAEDAARLLSTGTP